MNINEEELARALEFYTLEIKEYVSRTPLLRAYWPRISTRIVVATKLDAHLDEGAPKDVAVYYFTPVQDWALPFWKLAIQCAWLSAIEQHSDSLPVAGTRRGSLNLRCPVDMPLERLSDGQRDEVQSQGYNVIRYLIGTGYVIWGNDLWRNGSLVLPKFNKELGHEGLYKQIATPLALME